MSVSQVCAMRAIVQPRSWVWPLKPKPGIEGMTTVNASSALPP